MDRDGEYQRAGRPHPSHLPESITLGRTEGQGKTQVDDQEGRNRNGGSSPLSASSGLLLSLLPSSPLGTDSTATPPSSPLSSLEKNLFAQYPVRWARKRLAAVPTPQGLGLSRRHKLLVVWTALICVTLFLSRGILSLPNPFSGDAGTAGTGMYVSGFAARGHHIPAKIWQIMFVNPHQDTPEDDEASLSYDFDPDLIPYSNSWIARNPDWQYTLVGNEGADRFVRHHFAHAQHVLLGLRNHGARSDVMRYLLLLVEGGVYSDTDVACVKPIDKWIPHRWRDRVRVVVGIEGDSMGGSLISGMLWDVQFGQWT